MYCLYLKRPLFNGLPKRSICGLSSWAKVISSQWLCILTFSYFSPPHLVTLVTVTQCSYSDTFSPIKNHSCNKSVEYSDNLLIVTVLAVSKGVTLSGQPCSYSMRWPLYTRTLRGSSWRRRVWGAPRSARSTPRCCATWATTTAAARSSTARR